MNKRVVWKSFSDYEKEERWLNHMAADGWEMTSYVMGRYVFSKGIPGRYIYRVQLLDNLPSAEGSQEYLRLLKDAGIEYVDNHLRWIYIRRLAEDGPFELFSDRDSKIAHHKRVAALFGTVGAAQIPLVTVNLGNVIDHVRDGAFFSAPLMIVHFALVALLLIATVRHLSAAKRLARDSVVYD